MNRETLGVIGAGIMGSGIAQVCAQADYDVVLVDVSQEALSRGMNSIQGGAERLVAKAALSRVAADELVARIKTTTDYAALAAPTLIIEAASEKEALKLEILRKLDTIASADAILASNTSSISISRLGAALSRPERFIGMHFFNPVPVMTLIELIPGLQTSDATQQSALEFCERIGKTAIRVKSSPGFVVNRLLCPMINEAIFTLQEGIASAEDIDAAMKLGCNHPVGPLALADMIGLDTLLSILEVLHVEFGDPKYRPAPLLREMVAAGLRGRKSDRGFHNYSSAS